jgi:hypothetical protein
LRGSEDRTPEDIGGIIKNKSRINSYTRKNVSDEVRAYLDVRFANLTVGEVRSAIPGAKENESVRESFWQRVLEEASGHGASRPAIQKAWAKDKKDQETNGSSEVA